MIDYCVFAHSLNECCKLLNNYCEINSGGCCYVSSVLARLCEAYNVPYDIHMFDECRCYNVDDFQACVRDRCPDCCTGIASAVCAHYYVSVAGIPVNRGEYWDEVADDILLPEWMNGNDLEWIYETGDWNKDYDTDWNDFVKRILTVVFDATFQQGQ